MATPEEDNWKLLETATPSALDQPVKPAVEPEPLKAPEPPKTPEAVNVPEVTKEIRDDWEKLMNYDGRIDASVNTVGLALGFERSYNKKIHKRQFSEEQMDRINTLLKKGRELHIFRLIKVLSEDGTSILRNNGKPKYEYQFAVKPSSDLSFDDAMDEAEARKTGQLPKYKPPAPKAYEAVKIDLEPQIDKYKAAINQLTVLVDKYNSIFGEVGAHLTKDVEAKFKAVQDEIKAHKIKLDKIYNQITNILIQASRDDEKKLMHDFVNRHEEIRKGEATELKKLDVRFGALNPALGEIMKHLGKYKDIIMEFESAVNEFETAVNSNDAKGIDRAIGTGKDGEGAIGACFKKVDHLQENFLQPAFKRIPNDDLKDIFENNPDKRMYENQRKALVARITEIKERLARKNKQFEAEPAPLPDSVAEALDSNEDFRDFFKKFTGKFNSGRKEAVKAFELLQTTIHNLRNFYSEKIEEDTGRKPDAATLLAVNKELEVEVLGNGVDALIEFNSLLEELKNGEARIAKLRAQIDAMKNRMEELDQQSQEYNAQKDSIKDYSVTDRAAFFDAWQRAAEEYKQIENSIQTIEDAEKAKEGVQRDFAKIRNDIFASSEAFRVATELTIKHIGDEITEAKVQELSEKPEYKNVDFSDAVRKIHARLKKTIEKPIKDAFCAYERNEGGIADIRKAIDANPKGREYAVNAINISIQNLRTNGSDASTDKAEILEILKSELGI